MDKMFIGSNSDAGSVSGISGRVDLELKQHENKSTKII